jgi:predicted MFS family arabinose efflux permease
MSELNPNFGPAPARGVAPGANYILFLLCLVALFNFLDRQIFAILLQSIKDDLQVSDTAMGVLTGGAFALLYVIAGIPLARIADRGVRRNLIALCLAVWSTMTFLCGMAANYTQLIIARMGVAVGEAGSMPATFSMIPDLFPLNRRAGAVGLIYFAGAVGIGASLFLGALLNSHFGWRWTLFLVAIPGLILALVIRTTIREPARVEGVQDSQPIGRALRDLWRYPSFRCAAIFAALISFVAYGVLGWAPTFLLRVHHMPLPEVGFWVGLSMGVGGAAGPLVGGKLANRMVEKDVRGLFVIMALSPALALPFGLAFTFAASDTLSIASMFVYMTVIGMQVPAYFTLALILAGPQTRALATVIITMFQNIGGVALGPVVAGMLNDGLAQRFGDLAIRYSLASIVMALLLTVVVALIGTRYLKADYIEAKRLAEAPAK